MKKIFSTVAIVAALFAGYNTYNEQNKSNLFVAQVKLKIR